MIRLLQQLWDTVMNDEPLLRDRRDAGRHLAKALAEQGGLAQAQILALPRGGVIVADEISTALQLPLEVFVTRKLGAPGNPELAMGALTETGFRHLNSAVVQQFGVTEAGLEDEVRRQQEEIGRQVARYRQGQPLPALAGRTVILVDDGFATGATFLASLAGLRALGVGQLIAALPVAPATAQPELRSKADAVVLLHAPLRFYAIGQFYENFAQVEDDDVIAALARGRAHRRPDQGERR